MRNQFISGTLALTLACPGFMVADDKPAAPVQSPATTTSAKPAPTGFVLEDGTPVKLRLSRNLSSGTDKKGD